MQSKIIKITGIIFVSVLILFTGNMVQAQQNRKQGPPPIPNKEQVSKLVAGLEKKLELNNEQTKQISLLFNTHFEELKEQMKKDRINRDSQRMKMDKIRKDFENEVKTHLTDEQKILFTSHMKGLSPDNQKINNPEKQKSDK